MYEGEGDDLAAILTELQRWRAQALDGETGEGRAVSAAGESPGQRRDQEKGESVSRFVSSILQVSAPWFPLSRSSAIPTCKPSRRITGRGPTRPRNFPSSAASSAPRPTCRCSSVPSVRAARRAANSSWSTDSKGPAKPGYIRSLSTAALRAGFAAHRFHMRTCGGTEHLCQTLYHAGLTSDLIACVTGIPPARPRSPHFWPGFSLGGNVVLKLAGELGESARELDSRRMRGLRAARSGRLRAPHRRAPQSGVRSALRACHAQAYVHHRPLPEKRLPGSAHRAGTRRPLHRSLLRLRQRGATTTARSPPSAILHGIRVPTLMIQAMDDTFVPFSIYRSPEVRENPCVRLVSLPSSAATWASLAAPLNGYGRMA